MPIEEILCNECGEFFKDSPKPIAVEIEMEEHRYLGAVDCGDPDLWEPDPTYTPKVKNNIVQVKGWIYE